MTVLAMDGFDHYTSAERFAKGWNGSSAGMVAGRVSIPGYVNQAMTVLYNNENFKAMPGVTQDEFVFGVAIRNSSQPQLWSGHSFISFAASTGNGFSVGLDSVNIPYIACGGTTLHGSTPLFFDIWNYFEVKVSGGTVEMHLNGNSVTPEIPSTGIGAGSGFYKISLGSGSYAIFDYDDFYLCSLTGPDNNDFLGDVHIDTLYPTVDGTYRQWTPLSGTDHFAMVDEPQLDNDTTYNSEVTAGNKDSFVFQDMPFGIGQIFAAQLNLGVKKADSGLRQVKGLMIESGTNYLGPLETINTSYQFWSWLMDNDPAGGGWTTGEINANEFGIDLVV